MKELMHLCSKLVISGQEGGDHYRDESHQMDGSPAMLLRNEHYDIMSERNLFTQASKSRTIHTRGGESQLTSAGGNIPPSSALSTIHQRSNKTPDSRLGFRIKKPTHDLSAFVL